jgi:hypothetical protein
MLWRMKTRAIRNSERSAPSRTIWIGNHRSSVRLEPGAAFLRRSHFDISRLRSMHAGFYADCLTAAPGLREHLAMMH